MPLSIDSDGSSKTKMTCIYSPLLARDTTQTIFHPSDFFCSAVCQKFETRPTELAKLVIYNAGAVKI
jgi:hypothetical protein